MANSVIETVRKPLEWLPDYIEQVKGELRVPYDVSATRETIERLKAELAQKESVLDKGRALIRSEPVRELLCQYCDRDYAVWFAPNELWNAVALEEDWFLCPSCFTALAEERGIKTTAFFLTTEEDKDDKQKNC